MPQKNTEKREEILRVAYLLLSEYYYNKVTLGQIAERAGISKSLLQHYYYRKSDIMDTLINDILTRTFEYYSENSSREASLFQQISDFNMFFFTAAAKDRSMEHFISMSVSSEGLLEIWIDVITKWFWNIDRERSYPFLRLLSAISFSMAGTMYLYTHRDELGLDYKHICENHIRVILAYLNIGNEEISRIINITKQHLMDFEPEKFLHECKKKIGWMQ